MTREEELQLINEAVANGRIHKITHEEAEEYTWNMINQRSKAASLRIRRVNSRGLNHGSQQRAAKISDGIKP